MSGVGAGCPAPLPCGAGAVDGFDAAADTSSPSPARTAIGVLTATLSVPSGTTIFASTPSSAASTSMVALSVSISASTSPGFTGSPSFFSQRASLPCSIVGERAGMRMSVAMIARSRRLPSRARVEQHVGPELARIGLRIVAGELGRPVDRLAHLRGDLLQLVLRHPVPIEQAPAHLLDRIALLAHAGDLVTRAVLGRVRHRMAAVTVG